MPALSVQSLQGIAARTARRTVALPHHPVARLYTQAAAFVRHDRDRWVPLICAVGFALLSLADWLAA